MCLYHYWPLQFGVGMVGAVGGQHSTLHREAKVSLIAPQVALSPRCPPVSAFSPGHGIVVCPPACCHPRGCGLGVEAWAVMLHPPPVTGSRVHPGAFELFSNLNGTIKDDFSEFDNLRTSKKTGT